MTVQYCNVIDVSYSLGKRTEPKNVPDAESVHETFMDDDVFMKYGRTASGRSFFKSSISAEGHFSYVIFLSDDICARTSDSSATTRVFVGCHFQDPYGVFKQLLITHIYVSYLDFVS